MEIIGIIALLFLFARGGFSLSQFSNNGSSVQPPPPLSTGNPLTFQQGSFALAQSGQEGKEVQSGISTGTSVAENLAGSGGLLSNVVSSQVANAIPVVGAAIGAVASILLGQHSARLKGAIAENQLIPAVVQAFDADITEIVSAFNSRQATAQQCIAALQQMDSAIYSYMKSNAVGPGRAWREGGGPCDKGCTAECCIYYGDIHAAIYGASVFANGTVGMIPVLQGSGGQPSTNHKNMAYIPEVYPPPAQYGNFSRPSYWVTLNV